ncbi:hypothetical protein ACFOYU_13105 [Microvirga sp. GCM10011540]|uniref:hypothetical protein n=1 Tax=Microvirga sp. GCM10011540 TaxID=3317338 RepID=UPI003608A763
MDFDFQPLPKGRTHDLVVSLDRVDPGFLGWLTRLPENRRQIMYAVLAKAGADFLRPRRQGQEPTRPSSEQLLALRPVLTDMRQLRAGDLLERWYGSSPDGFLGAVSKTKEGPQGGAYYARLHTVFTDPKHKQIAKIVRLLPTINFGRLNVLMALDPIFLSPGFCSKVRDAQQAADLSTALMLIRQVVGEDASDEALTNSIRSIGENTSVSQWVATWLSRAGHIACPRLNLDPEWQALDSGEKLRDTGLRLQVCLGTAERVIETLKGQKFYYENTRHSMIAEVQAVGPQRFLILAGVHARRNAPVPRRMHREVEEEFLAAGVPSLTSWPEDCPWRAIERIPNGFYDFGIEEDFDLCGLEGEAA